MINVIDVEILSLVSWTRRSCRRHPKKQNPPLHASSLLLCPGCGVWCLVSWPLVFSCLCGRSLTFTCLVSSRLVFVLFPCLSLPCPCLYRILSTPKVLHIKPEDTKDQRPTSAGTTRPKTRPIQHNQEPSSKIVLCQRSVCTRQLTWVLRRKGGVENHEESAIYVCGLRSQQQQRGMPSFFCLCICP
jgi:hypothetical protein